MFLLRRDDATADAVHCFSLAGAGDVVEFAFDREQGGGGDVLRPHAFGLAIDTHNVPGAADQTEVLKDDPDGVEVVVGVHVEHGVVFVVELAVRLGAGAISLDQVPEVVVMALGMVARVHRDKARVLQKSRVNAPARAGKIGRNAVNHVVLKPVVALGHGQIVNRRR